MNIIYSMHHIIIHLRYIHVNDAVLVDFMAVRAHLEVKSARPSSRFSALGGSVAFSYMW